MIIFNHNIEKLKSCKFIREHSFSKSKSINFYLNDKLSAVITQPLTITSFINFQYLFKFKYFLKATTVCVVLHKY